MAPSLLPTAAPSSHTAAQAAGSGSAAQGVASGHPSGQRDERQGGGRDLGEAEAGSAHGSGRVTAADGSGVAAVTAGSDATFTGLFEVSAALTGDSQATGELIAFLEPCTAH